MINLVLLRYSKTNKLKVMSMKYLPFCPRANELNLQVCQVKFTPMLNLIFSNEWNHSHVSFTIKVIKSHKFHSATKKYPTMHHFITEMFMCAHLCYKVVHCGIWNWFIVRFMWKVNQPLSTMLLTTSDDKFEILVLPNWNNFAWWGNPLDPERCEIILQVYFSNSFYELIT